MKTTYFNVLSESYFILKQNEIICVKVKYGLNS